MHICFWSFIPIARWLLPPFWVSDCKEHPHKLDNLVLMIEIFSCYKSRHWERNMLTHLLANISCLLIGEANSFLQLKVKDKQMSGHVFPPNSSYYFSLFQISFMGQNVYEHLFIKTFFMCNVNFLKSLLEFKERAFASSNIYLYIWRHQKAHPR